ncbi:MAG TPA: hypothetical protein VFZ09_02750 [Archangium sp.]|uniref:hypothetical protein n=1 Tax=Archangium sp. TaxID=1872627 RepID=UPI002E35DBE5|nr:hypothetical protein [Archangium sp.]HEX5745132.1 hypothetical protein [Archangium sp.]
MSRKTATSPRRASGRFPKISAVTPLPGSRVESAQGWIEAMVMPREQPGATWQPSIARDRSHAHKSACEQSKCFRDAVLNYLQAHHLMGAVRWISEPGSTEMVTLYCTPRVLEQLQRSREFDAGRAAGLEMYT